MSEYTAGPWVIFIDRDEAEFIVMPAMRPGQIATVWAKDADDPIASANARLIAAAPDLLEAIGDLIAIAEDRFMGMSHMAIDRARAAIAKAEGRS